jgi:hypothetical protein
MSFRVVAVIGFLSLSALAGAAADGVRAKYSPVQYLKNFALSVCLADGYASGEAEKDSLAVASGYSELGDLPFEAYEEAESLARTFLAKEYKSVSGQRLILMKCVDLFHSRELDQIAKKYSKK